MVILRQATEVDLGSILTIYNQGVEDRIATLETDIKDEAYMSEWFNKHQGRYSVLIAEQNDQVVGGLLSIHITLEAHMTVSVTSPFIFIVIITVKGSENSYFRD